MVMPVRRLEGKVALITGANSGIGAVAARLFAAEGAKVVLTGRNETRGSKIAADIVAKGGNAMFHAADISDEHSVEGLFKVISDRFGGLDILYNNAGGSSAADGPVTTGAPAEFWRVIGVDLFGTWLTCRHAVPMMADRGGGAIVNSSSIAGAMGLPGIDAYTAAKGGVIAMTRSMAVEFAPQGIRVNCLVAGMVLTERIKALLQDNHRLAKQLDAYLLPLPEPESVARAALFLASDEARATTGHALPVESGILIS